MTHKPETVGRVTLMHKQGFGYYAISRRLGVSLTECRQILDPNLAEKQRGEFLSEAFQEADDLRP